MPQSNPDFIPDATPDFIADAPPAAAKPQQHGLSLLRHPLDNARQIGSEIYQQAGDAVGRTYPGRLAKLVTHSITGQKIPGEAEGIAEDAGRDFAFAAAGGPESTERPTVQPVARPTTTGPQSLRGIPGGARSAGLGEIPVRPSIAGTPESLGRIPIQPEPEALPSFNIKRPGEIAPEKVRYPRAFFGGQRAEPIPSREGLMLPEPKPTAPTRVATPSAPVAPARPLELMPEDPGQVGKRPAQFIETPEDRLETRSIQEAMRDKGEAEDQMRLRLGRDRFVDNPKSSRIAAANAARGVSTIDPPVKLTRTPGVTARLGKLEPTPGDADLEDLLKRSVAKVKASR